MLMDELSKDGIHHVHSLKGVYVMIHSLLNSAFPKEPRDVFYRFAESYHDGFPAWILVEDGLIKGMTFVIPNSKGGTLECMAIDPELWGHGAGRALVDAVVNDFGGFLTLTTRVPEFYEKAGFNRITSFKDGSTAMYKCCV